MCDKLRHNTKAAICLRSPEVILFEFSVIPAKLEEGFSLISLSCRLVSWPTKILAKSLAWTFHWPEDIVGGLSLDIYIIYTFSYLKTGMVSPRENHPVLICPVTFLLLSTDYFLCLVWLQMLQAVWLPSLFVEIIPWPNKSHSLPGYTEMVFSLILCQCICFWPSACCCLILETIALFMFLSSRLA